MVMLELAWMFNKIKFRHAVCPLIEAIIEIFEISTWFMIILIWFIYLTLIFKPRLWQHFQRNDIFGDAALAG